VKYRLLDWLCCPSCGHDKLDIEVLREHHVPTFNGHVHPDDVDAPGLDLTHKEGTEILDGTLTCESCHRSYAVSDGIPRMLLEGEGAAAPTSAHAWTTFDQAEPVWEQNFLDYIQPVDFESFLGQVVLDAGCGFGRHAYFAARYGAEVIAIDSAPEAVAAARRNTQALQQVHIIQGNVLNPPVRDGSIDLAYCFGVLHHMETPQDAFQAIGLKVRTGGRLCVWTHGPRQGASGAASRALRGMAGQMDPHQLYSLSRVIASGLRIFSHTPYKLLGPVPGLGAVVRHLPVHDHHKWPYPVVVADIYDRLQFDVKHTMTGEALERWFLDEGYAAVEVTRRVGNNESFRGTGLKR
jgi:SAM-dependent methyltransferase